MKSYTENSFSSTFMNLYTPRIFVLIKKSIFNEIDVNKAGTTSAEQNKFDV